MERQEMVDSEALCRRGVETGFTEPPPRKVMSPLIDVHTHAGVGGDTPQLLAAAQLYHVARLVTIAPLEESLELAGRYPGRTVPAATLLYEHRQEADRFAAENIELLQRGEAAGLRVVKFWFKPPFNVRMSLKLDDRRLDPIFSEMERLRLVALVHIADPDIWWIKYYGDRSIYDTKEVTYLQIEHRLAANPGVPFILAHFGGDPEHLDHLDRLLSTYPNLYLDTSATKWIVRELGRQRKAAREFCQRWSGRLLFGTDQVVINHSEPARYTSRYWIHQVFWETDIVCPLPIADPDSEGPPLIRGLDLPAEVLAAIYHDNAVRVLRLPDV